MDRLRNQTAIVSGIGSGIGWVAAERFRAEGAEVVGIEFDADRAARAAHELGLVPIIDSVDDTDTWDAAVAAAGDLDGLGVVYLNAGVYGFTGPIDELPLDLYRRTVGANIVAFAPSPLYTLTKQAVTGFGKERCSS